MQLNEFSDSKGSRELMVKFTCRRCKKELIEPLQDVIKRSNEVYGHLHNLREPEGWYEALHGPLFCPDCYKAYERFLKNEEVSNGSND